MVGRDKGEATRPGAGQPVLPEAGKGVAVLSGHTKAVESASFNPDGKRVVTASSDRTAKIWDVGWLLMHQESLRASVCAERLANDGQFTADELPDPILSNIDPNDRIACNPCLRRGPLSLDYWTRLPGQWLAAIRRIGSP